MVVGAAFLGAGVLGFVPGVTTDYDQLAFAGHDSGARLLGLFQVSVLHNLVHLLFGVLAPACSRTPRGAALFLLYAGMVYVFLWLMGLAPGEHDSVNVLPVNAADDWLHLGLGVAMLALALLAQPSLRPRRADHGR